MKNLKLLLLILIPFSCFSQDQFIIDSFNINLGDHALNYKVEQSLGDIDNGEIYYKYYTDKEYILGEKIFKIELRTFVNKVNGVFIYLDINNIQKLKNTIENYYGNCKNLNDLKYEWINTSNKMILGKKDNENYIIITVEPNYKYP